MIATDRILIDPTLTEIRAALAAAVKAVNVLFCDGSGLALEADDAPALAREMHTHSEGSRTWRVPARVWRFRSEAELLAAWWTDFVGRTHLRLMGGRSQDGDPLPVSAPTFPALACVYPGHVVLRDRNRRSELLVVCDCGAWGRPEKIAWMGTQCGPCFDRAEEQAAGGMSVLRCEGVVRAVAFSPDGKYLATVDSRHTLHLWDVEQGRVVLGSEMQNVAGRVCFSPDGGLLACGSEQGDGTRLLRLRDGQRAVAEGYPYAFFPSGTIVLCGRAQHQLNVRFGCEDQLDIGRWFLAADQPIYFPSAAEAMELAVSPDGRLLAASCGLQGPLLWDLCSGQPYLYTSEANATGQLVFSSDGAILAAKAERPTAEVILCDVQAQRVRSQVGVRQTNSFAFTADGTFLVTAEGHDTLRVWDVQTAVERQALYLPIDDRLESMALSPCGRLLALGMASGAVRLWPAEILRVDG
jgi:hypothetical protein